METKFQTSFIPKRPITAESAVKTHRGISLFMAIGTILFLVSLSGAGFVVFWKTKLMTDQASYQDTLAKNEDQFNPQLIDTLRRINTKIDVSKALLNNHLAVSALFGIIGALTADNVGFKSLDYSAPLNVQGGGSNSSTNNNGAQISMSGVGASFSAIAFQSDVFGKSVQYGQNIVIKSPVLSGLSLDDSGQVSFTFTAYIDPSNLSYQKILDQSLGNNTASSSTNLNQ